MINPCIICDDYISCPYEGDSTPNKCKIKNKHLKELKMVNKLLKDKTNEQALEDKPQYECFMLKVEAKSRTIMTGFENKYIKPAALLKAIEKLPGKLKIGAPVSYEGVFITPYKIAAITAKEFKVFYQMFLYTGLQDFYFVRRKVK